MITEEELAMLYGLIGQGIWHLQHVEHALTTCLTIKGEIKEIGSVSREDAEKILAKHRRNTLGTSIRIAKEKDVLSGPLMEALDAFKNERDWLVHRSVHENGDDLYLDLRRGTLFIRLNQFSDQARALQKLIGKELEDYVVSKGVSREGIYRNAIKEVMEKRGGNA